MGDHRLHFRGNSGDVTMAKRQKPKRYQYEGMIIEQGATGWHVLDWDYEEEYWRATLRSEHAAQQYVLQQYGG